MLKIGITGLKEDELSQLFPLFKPNKDGLLDYKDFVSILYSNKSISSKKQPKDSSEKTNPEENEAQNNLPKKELLSQTPVENVLNKIIDRLAARGIQGLCSS